MPRHTAQYAITSGLSGCYMPDNGPWLFEADTRAALMSCIRDEIESQDFPKSAIRQVKARKLWSFIQRHGSSVAHFSITHNGREIAFHGLTNAEADEMRESDW